MSGDPPLYVNQLKNLAYDYYTDFYESPRSISYFELSHQVGIKDNIRVLDYISEAIDEGCKDKQNEKNKKTKKELFERIGLPEDERWDLVE